MEGKTILCAIDFSESSIQALRWTLKEAKLIDARVTILFCYRLISDQSKSVLDLKRLIELDANQKFRKIEAEIVHGNGPAYQFITEVGFFSSRIASLIENTPVCMVVIGNSIIEFFNDNHNPSFETFLMTSLIPVVILPEGTQVNKKLESKISA